jgi:ABC-type multidrug transport system fused ATPase/permease subunit
MKTLLELWQLLDRQQRRRLVLLQLVSLMMAFSTLVGIAAVLPFFTVLAEPQSIGRTASLAALYEHLRFDSERSFMVALGCGFVALVLLANVINLLGSLAIGRFALQVGNTFYVALFAEYLHRDYQFHASANSATLSRNVIYETGRVISGILQCGLVLVTNLATIVLVVTSVVILNPWVASCAFVALGATYALLYVFARGRLRRNGLTESRFAEERAKVVNESFGAIKEIIVLRGQGYFLDRFARACSSIAGSVANTLAIAQTPRHVVECLIVAVLVGIALFLSGSGEGIRPWLAELTFLAFAAYRLLPAVQQAFSSVVRIRAERAAFENIAGDLRRARARNSGVDPAPTECSWLGMPRHEVRLRDVSFSYGTGQPPAIRGISVRIPAGAAVGIVGANGSGKTTLVDVIAGLLVAQSGTLEVDGRTVDEANRSAWQSAIAYVPQHIYLIDSTVTGNIALGVPADGVDRERVREAMRLAQLDACVAALPSGINERLGERGARLSGGQRQRIAIARALYRNASLLILDEATDQLDVSAEREVMSAIERLRGGRTMILISHRLHSLQQCDMILELENGVIVRSGRWEEMQHAGHFRQAPGLRPAAKATRRSNRR